MKILLIQDTDWINKGPFQQNHLMEKLSMRSHNIHVIDHEIEWGKKNKGGIFSHRQVFTNVSRINPDAKITLIRPGIIKMPNLDYLSLIISRTSEVENQIRDFSPDIIIGFHILSAFIGMRAAKKYNIPFIYYWVDVYHTQLSFKPYQYIGKILERKTIQNSDRILVINEKLKEYVIELGSDIKKTFVIRGSVDLKMFNPDINTSEIKAKYNIIDSDIILGFVGMFHKDLALKELIIKLAKAKNPKFKLLIVGEEDKTALDGVQKLRKIAKEYKIEKQVILTGKIPYNEVPSLINIARICLLPAYNRNMMQNIVPIKLYEYLAMRKPVISTKLPGVIKEFGEENGVVYVDNPEEIIDKSIELVANSNISELGNKARKFVEKNNWEKITDEFEKVLLEVIEEWRK